MVKSTTAKEFTKGRNGLSALPLLNGEELPWTRLACPILQQTATEFDSFQEELTLLGTADELTLVQNVGDYVQLFLVQVPKLLFRENVAHSGNEYVVNIYGNKLTEFRVL